MSFIRADAQTKLLLFGEHAAVYGYPAVGTPLPWKVSVSLAPSQKMKGVILALMEQIFILFPELYAKPPVKIRITGEIPIGAGFGSSGALCVALVRALFQYLKIQKDNENDLRYAIWEYAHELEKVFHKTPSGIDTGLSCFEKISYFRGLQGNLPKIHRLQDVELSLVIGAIPRASNTAALVSGLRLRKESDKQSNGLIEELGVFANDAIEHLLLNRPNLMAELGALATCAHQHLSALNLSHPDLDTMILKGLEYGALGGKLSGAGSGGAYVLFVQNKPQALEIAKALKIFAQKNKVPHTLMPTICG